jgi:hypothetical protein
MGLIGAGTDKFTAPEPLEAGHDLAAFVCGEPTLDDWLRRRALPNQISGVSRTYVLSRENSCHWVLHARGRRDCGR